MGRKTSAFHGQRLWYLVAEIIESAATNEKWETYGLTESEIEKLEEWKRDRKQIGKWQERAIKISPFQDDLTIMIVGSQAAEFVSGRVRVILAELDIKLSSKPDANLPFATRFTSIGARYDTSNPNDLKVTPTCEVMTKFNEMVRESATKASKLEDLENVQRWTDTAQFLSAFLTDGRFFLNSSYAALAGARHLRTQENKVMVTEEMVADLHQLNDIIKSGK